MNEWKVVPRPITPKVHDYAVVEPIEDRERIVAGEIWDFKEALKMAAAPDLYEAAKVALGAVSSRLDRIEYEALEKAIAKADGFEPEEV